LGSVAFGGENDTGNPMDRKLPGLNSAWFTADVGDLNARPIRYCLQIQEGFGYSESVLLDKIEWAFETWNQYLRERDTFQRVDPRFDRVLSLRRKILSECDGTQDLTFYLGVNDPVVEKYKTQFHAPTAFTQRLDQDYFSGWGKGFVWLSVPHVSQDPQCVPIPHWTGVTGELNLRGTLLHEIGHVYGTGHISGTIMDEQLNVNRCINPKDAEDFEIEASPLHRYRMTHIDGWKDLDFDYGVGLSFNGISLMLDGEKNFLDLVGRGAVCPV